MGEVTTPLPPLDTFNLQRVNQTDTGDNSEQAKVLARYCEEIKSSAGVLLAHMAAGEIYASAIAKDAGADPQQLGEHKRRFAIAKTELETSVMWAVKALFVNRMRGGE